MPDVRRRRRSDPRARPGTRPGDGRIYTLVVTAALALFNACAPDDPSAGPTPDALVPFATAPLAPPADRDEAVARQLPLGLVPEPRRALVSPRPIEPDALRGGPYDVIVEDASQDSAEGALGAATRAGLTGRRAALTAHGVYVLWLPARATEEEGLRTQARRMGAVFARVTLWRDDFAAHPTRVGLAGHADETPLDPGALVAAARALPAEDPSGLGTYPTALPFFFYAGDLGAAEGRLGAATAGVLAEDALLGLERRLATAVPPASDPYLARLDAAERRRAGAGLALRTLSVALTLDRPREHRRALLEYVRAVPGADRPPLDPWVR